MTAEIAATVRKAPTASAGKTAGLALLANVDFALLISAGIQLQSIRQNKATGLVDDTEGQKMKRQYRWSYSE
jgi:hypothetical protein